MSTIKCSDIETSTIILANGQYPQHPLPLKILSHASEIICCDGALLSMFKEKITPSVVIGDFDSLQPVDYWQKQFPTTQFIHNPSQYSTDLTKAVLLCKERGRKNITILGATGLREDHTLGNISHLIQYIEWFDHLTMVTDTGIFYPILKTTEFEVEKGRQVSVFSFIPDTKITYKGLKYPIYNQSLQLWEGSLNEAEDSRFTIEFTDGKVIVFINYI